MEMLKNAPNLDFRKYFEILREIDPIERSGKVMKVVGLTVESNGPAVNMGNICRIYPSKGDKYREINMLKRKSSGLMIKGFF